MVLVAKIVDTDLSARRQSKRESFLLSFDEINDSIVFSLHSYFNLISFQFSLRHQLKDDSESIEFNSLKTEMKNGSAKNFKTDSHANPTLLLKEFQSSNNSIEKN